MTLDALDDRLLDAPSIYRTPYRRPELTEAREWCAHLANTHYENFHVATMLLPRALKPHFQSVYAFCRTSDDLGDEVPDKANARQLLASWRGMLHQAFEAPQISRHPVFVALAPTIESRSVPVTPFDDLISAFEYDQDHPKHESIASLEKYSRYSANPVGRLVLLISGYPSEELGKLSDDICTGLQLANFYQDIYEDYERGRRYLPADLMRQFGVEERQIAERDFDNRFRSLMEYLVSDARARLLRGSALVNAVERDLETTLSLFVKGGLAILDAIAAQDYNTLSHRPTVSRKVKAQLLAGALRGRLLAAVLPRRDRHALPSQEQRS